ncbi:MarR family transcriptional regulator [Amycolatopsis mediterranei S699]|uniref:MarR family transcriptional regulator n=2 Tax=Amycolatopsis mediterranei TaxID=33910 RepID=A0A0H3DDZ4_AMYMU|nr:MarR family transcriptional regulator [Amycolatopsis mediterranei]ADJ48452.1 MarR family transcriptional regulator [Amycolatopsis mediterranei U32]AEK45373.1 MarR family transcriptional regulator [Amycolatopsis mediterranei S699]AFO80163.1 MarR family transcriptional regulator [Amycolatopsis mediterranei S699]AGT87291.1 MarR family transcriptional regulator [Amycolatopsis mediterranei RB]KDO10969.1 MarR family transcriptional regulator [Amycolatopsis mediterranei]
MGEVPPHVAESAGWIRAVVGQLHRRLRQVDNAGILTPSQSAVLNRLYREGPATQGELAAAEHVRQQSMAATLGVLDELGYLARTPDPADRRRVVISLSESGTDTVRGVFQHRDEWLARALVDELSPAELDAVTRALPLLQRVAQH